MSGKHASEEAKKEFIAKAMEFRKLGAELARLMSDPKLCLTKEQFHKLYKAVLAARMLRHNIEDVFLVCISTDHPRVGDWRVVYGMQDNP